MPKTSPFSDRPDLASRASSALLLTALALLQAGCSCTPAVSPDAGSGGDADVDGSRPPRPQPCTDGIRRIDVDGIPRLDHEAGSTGTRVEVHGDTVLLVRQESAPDGSRILLVRIDARDGRVLASGTQDLSSSSDASVIRAMRLLPDGSAEVLFIALDPSVRVARFGADGAPLGIVEGHGERIPAYGSTAIATESGFFVVGRVAEQLTAVRLEDGLVSPVPLGRTVGSSPAALPSLATADGHTIWIADPMRADDQMTVRIERLDLRTPSVAPIHVERTMDASEGYDGFTIGAAPDGTAVLLTTTLGQISLTWLGAGVETLGEWTVPSGTSVVGLIGVAGATPDQALAFWDSAGPTGVGGVRFARAYAPGDVGGGLTRIVEARYEGQGMMAFGQRSDGAYTLAWWEGGLSIVTFCQAP